MKLLVGRALFRWVIHKFQFCGVQTKKKNLQSKSPTKEPFFFCSTHTESNKNCEMVMNNPRERWWICNQPHTGYSLVDDDYGTTTKRRNTPILMHSLATGQDDFCEPTLPWVAKCALSIVQKSRKAPAKARNYAIFMRKKNFSLPTLVNTFKNTTNTKPPIGYT